MSVSFARAVADGLRRHGITVHYWGGWEQRGNGMSSAYQGCSQHHTATAFGMAPVVLVNGRSDLRGPLCNSAGNHDGSITIIAAHPANHAGASGARSKNLGPLPQSGSFNRYMWGHEIVYPGTQPMTPAQRHSALVLSGVIGGILRRPNAEWIRSHHETSLTGKWDPGEAPARPIDMNRFRADIWPALHDTTPTAPPPPVEDDMQPDERAALFLLVNEVLGPRGKNGQIAGWGTTNGPRTMVAMLVDLVNAAYTPIPSAVGGSDVKLPPRQMLANTDAYGFTQGRQVASLLAAFDELADAYANERTTDAEQIKAAVREALETSAVNVDVTVSGAVPPNDVAGERSAMGDIHG